jgi:hypothetical protein
MNAVVPVANRRWVQYAVAVLFSAPSVLAAWLVLIFVTPKLKQMCADTGFDGAALFRPMDFVVEFRWWIAGLLALFVWGAEVWLPLWRHSRRAFLAGGVFVLNALVLAGLVASLVLSAMVGPAMGSKANKAAATVRH